MPESEKMVEIDGGVPFPVVLFDGVCEINMGDVKIQSSLQFKDFQFVISQKIGISPNQISIYLVDRNKSKSAPEIRRRIPITGKVNFSVITREKDCLFLVVLKRSRRERRVKSKQINAAEFTDYLPEGTWSPSPANLLLLRRNQPELRNSQILGYNNQISPSEFGDYSDTLRDFQIQRRYYEFNLNLYSNSNSNFYMEAFPTIENGFAISSDRSLCEECTNAKMNRRAATFHWCVYDAVTVGFRSPAGPIARPPKPYS